MPVPAYSGPNVSTANGVALTFPYDFLILDETHLAVTVDGVVQTSGYSVTGVGSESGGNVVFSTAPADQSQVVRDRVVPYDRTEVDYQEGGPFQAATVDEDVDLATMQIQQLAAAVKRAPKAPRSVSTDQTISEDDWLAGAGKAFRRKPDGSGVDLVSLDDVGDTYSPGYTNAVPRSFSAKVADFASIKDFGAVGDGVTNDTAALNKALTDLSDGDVLFWPDGDYLLDAVTTAKKIHHVSFGFGKRTITGSKPSVSWILNDNAAHLYKFSDLQTAIGSVTQTLQFVGIALNGNGKTVTDALMVVEGVSGPMFEKSTWSNVTGSALRLREAWEVWFSFCGAFNVDASGSSGVIVFDDRYNSDSALNVNNVRWHGGHMENNLGVYFFAHETSQLQIFDCYDSKFEWGRDSIPSSGPWSVFEIRNGFRVNIHGNTFSNFNNANKYDVLFEMGYANGGTDYQCTFSIHDNHYYGVDASTKDLGVRGSARGECKDNTCVSSTNVIPTCSGASICPFSYEPPRCLDTGTIAYGTDTANKMLPIVARASRAGHAFVSVHELGVPTGSSVAPLFIADANARSVQGTAIQSASSAGARIVNIPNYLFGKMPMAMRLGVRCRSETGAGLITLTVNNTNPFTSRIVGSTYEMQIFDIPKRYFDVMADSASDIFRLITGTGNAEGVIVDGVFFLPAEYLPQATVRWFDDFLGDVLADQWGSAVGTDPQCVAPAALASGSDRRGVVRLTAGDDAAASMAANGVQLVSSLQWRADSGGLVFEARVKLVTNITSVAWFIGLTDTLSLEMPFTLGGSDALTSDATNAVGVLFDTAADTDQWCLVGVAADVDATKQFTGFAPVAGTYETWRIELSTAGVATFYRNGAKVGTAMTGAVTATTLLTPYIGGFSRTTATRVIDADYVLVECDR